MPLPGSRGLGSRYELLKQVGHGAMGDVWQALDKTDNKVVAAKLLHRHFATDTAVVGRFVQERSILMELRHPNIVSVLDLVVEGQDLAIIMEFIDGGTLGAYRQQVGTLPAGVAVPVVCGVLSAVAFAHSKGVLHRDIKADNVLLVGGQALGEASVRLTDFGIARLTQDSSVKATGLLGTPAYMSPELLSAGLAGPASDVYAVGVLLYEVLAGRTPFEGGATAVAVGMRHVYSSPPKIPVDQQLWRVIETMLAKDPEMRMNAADTLAVLRALPPTALSTPALPVQEPPPDWDGIPAPGQEPAGLRTTGGTELTSTRVPTGPVTPKPQPPPVNPPPIANLGDTGDITTTRLAQPEPAVMPLPKPGATGKSGKRTRNMVLISAGVVLVVVALVVGMLFLRRGQSTPPPVVYTAGHLIGDEAPTGLSLDYEADNATDPGNAVLTITAHANRLSGLTGDILWAFPDDNGQCPTIVLADSVYPVEPVLASKDGVSTPCGRKTTVNITPGGTQRIKLTLSGVTTQDLGAWLTQVQSLTDQVLRTVVGSDFALQRLTGVRITATSVRMHGETPVPYQVFPVWPGQTSTDQVDPLFTNDTLDYQATDLLRSLTGGTGLKGVTITACTQAQVNGHRLIALQPTTSCQVQVRVGAIDPAQTSFTITMI